MNHCAGKNTYLASTVRFHEHYLSLSKLNSLSQWKGYIPSSLHYSIQTYYMEFFPGEMPNQTFYTKQKFFTNKHSELYTKNNTIVTLFKQSGILKISDLYQLEVLLFMHDYSHQKLPPSFTDIYSINRDTNGSCETRQADMFYVARTKSKSFDELSLFQFATIWNRWNIQMNVNNSRVCLKRPFKTKRLDSYDAVVIAGTAASHHNLIRVMFLCPKPSLVFVHRDGW
jgi:hypothetical protein